MTRISVVVPVYNCEEYLEQCIKSVLNQTIKDLEIICIDDGSTDSSLRILQKFAAEDSRVVLLQQENQGAGIARNRGMRIARGKYLTFLDADDYYFDNSALEAMYNACENFNVLLCASRKIRRVKSNEQTDNLEIFPIETINRIVNYKDFQSDYFYQTYLFQREMLIENEIFFPDYRRYQDPPFLVRASYTAETFVVLDNCLYCYRMPDVITRFNMQKAVDLLKGVMDNLIFAQKHRLDILFHNTVDRLEYEYSSIIFESISSNDLEILKLLMRINQIVCDVYNTPDYIIKPLRRILFSQERYEQELLSKIKKEKQIALYGAGELTKAFLCYLSSKNIDISKHISKIIVSDLRIRESHLNGVPILSLQEFLRGEPVFVLVTTGKKIADDIVSNLIKNRFSNYDVIDDVFGDILLYSELRKNRSQ